MLHPTAKSLELAETILDARRASEQGIRAVLGDRDSARLAELLARLIDGLDSAKSPPVALEAKA
jgi:hypothetical protein